MKQSRKQRKEARVRQSYLSQLKPAIATVPVTSATAAASIVEAAPVEPIVEEMQVEEQAPATEQIPESVPIEAPSIPPPPDSQVRVVDAIPSDGVPANDQDLAATSSSNEEKVESEEKDVGEQTPTDQSDEIDEIMVERLFDQRILSLLPKYSRERWEFCEVQLCQVAYYVELSEFLARCTWPHHMLYRLSLVNGVKFWHGRTPTSAGKLVWEEFRMRVRRESALERIAENRIVGTEECDGNVAQIRPPSSKSEAA